MTTAPLYDQEPAETERRRLLALGAILHSEQYVTNSQVVISYSLPTMELNLEPYEETKPDQIAEKPHH